MRVASLFSGIGGFEIGFADGCDLALQNDIDQAAQAVLSERFPSVPMLPDVTELCPDQLGGPDMIVAGFPCQDVSIVGGQRGMAGKKSSLVEHVFRLTGEGV